MRLTRTEAALAGLFWVPLALAAAWIVVWPPHTVDGPAHLLGATAMVGHEFNGGIYDAYYDLDWFPTPNLAGTTLLAELVKVGSMRFAETVVLIAASVGVPLALRYAIRGVRRESGWLAVAGLPLSFGYLYFYGFYNYCLGVALALLCAGAALRAAPRWRPGPTLGLAALLTLTWLTHLVPFVAAVVFLAAVVIAGPRTLRAWLPAAGTLLPGVALSFAYLVHTDSGDAPAWSGPVGRVVGLVSLHTTVTTFSRWEDGIAAVLAGVLVALAVWARRVGGLGWTPAAVAAAVAAGLVLITPTSFGIDFGLIDERLAVFPVLFGLVWLAAAPPPPRVALAAAVAVVLVTGALAAVRLPELRRYDRLADEYASAESMLEPATVLIALRFHGYGPDAGRNASWDPTRHLASALAASTGSVDAGHYEAVLDYFPARFTAEYDFRRALDPDLTGLESVPPRVDLAAADAFGGAPIPYVLLVGAPDATGEAATALAATRAMLAQHYERVGVTSPRGLVEIWRAR